MHKTRLVPVTTQEHDAFIHAQARRPENAEFFRRQASPNLWPKDTVSWWAPCFIVERSDNGAMVGMASVSNIDAQNRQLDIGLFLDKELCSPLTSKELAIDSISQLINYVFDYLQYEKVSARMLEHRSALQALLAEYGFKQEALLRNNVWFQGKFQNEVSFALLRSEWRK